ncbi:MAG: YfcE family phosphodiesterase [Oscillospiraceae bacterium]|nr:YfcE family phosphodiesterase [Oscillospiraceae bacterium]
MKILVLSDSHSTMRFMKKCVERLKPDAIVHLGDHYDDGETLGELYPRIPLHQVAGNCDRYRCPIHAREMLCYPLGGVMTYMTHGHREQVKSGIGGLVAEARRYNAQVALYGHTHIPYCRQEEDGLWILNPGSASHSAGILKTDGQAVTACYLITEADLEEKL